MLEAVNGHHAGLTNFSGLEPSLRDSVVGRPYLNINDGKTPSLSGQEEYKKAFAYFRNTHPDEMLRVPKWNLPCDADNLETMLYTRMLFSCLMDADYSVSAWADDPSYFDAFEAPELDAAECLGQLYAFCDDIRKNSKADGKVNRIRDRVFDEKAAAVSRCQENGSSEPIP